MTFSGKAAIVTGGAGALGRVCVEQLLEVNLKVAIPYRSEKPPSSTSATLPRYASNVLAVQADLTEENQVTRFVSEAVRTFGSVDYLINTAGGYTGGSTIDQVTIEDWENIMRMNARTAFLICRGVLLEMGKRSFGRIVNIAAMPALSPGARKGPYAVSKRAVVTLTETIAEETKGKGITANAIAPSTILTESNRRSMPDADFSRWVTPLDIAHLALYLCSDEARSISGNVIKIYGGA